MIKTYKKAYHPLALPNSISFGPKANLTTPFQTEYLILHAVAALSYPNKVEVYNYIHGALHFSTLNKYIGRLNRQGYLEKKQKRVSLSSKLGTLTLGLCLTNKGDTALSNSALSLQYEWQFFHGMYLNHIVKNPVPYDYFNESRALFQHYKAKFNNGESTHDANRISAKFFDPRLNMKPCSIMYYIILYILRKHRPVSFNELKKQVCRASSSSSAHLILKSMVHYNYLQHFTRKNNSKHAGSGGYTFTDFGLAWMHACHDEMKLNIEALPEHMKVTLSHAYYDETHNCPLSSDRVQPLIISESPDQP